LGGAVFAVCVGVAWLDLTSFEQYAWFSFVGTVAATVAVYLIGGAGRGGATPVRLTLAGVALGARTRHLRRFGPWSLWGPATRRARPRRQTNQRPSRISSRSGSSFASRQA